MKRKWILFWGIIISLGIGLTMGIPIIIIYGDLNDYDIINKRTSFFYAPEVAQSVENISISSEIGDIEVQYVYPPKEYAVKIEIILEMSGYNLIGDNLEDFFAIDWDNQTYANLTCNLRQEFDVSSILPLIENLKILVSLRADVIFNINSHMELGDLHISIPFGVNVNNIYVNNVNGGILYDFQNCNFQGRLKTINKQGITEVYSTDVRYTQGSSVHYSIGSGILNLYISQSEVIGANVTCTAEITNGAFYLDYYDNSPDIGTQIEIPTNTSTDYVFPLWFQSIYEDWPVFGFYNETPDLDLIHTYSDHFLFISNGLYENRVLCYYNWTFYLVKQWFNLKLNSTG